MADQNDNKIEPIAQPPSIIEKLLSGSKVVALILSTLAAGVIAMSQSGALPIPPALLAVATSIVAIAAALGIASPGLAPKPAAPPAEPKVGPPAE